MAFQSMKLRINQYLRPFTNPKSIGRIKKEYSSVTVFYEMPLLNYTSDQTSVLFLYESHNDYSQEQSGHFMHKVCMKAAQRLEPGVTRAHYIPNSRGLIETIDVFDKDWERFVKYFHQELNTFLRTRHEVLGILFFRVEHGLKCANEQLVFYKMSNTVQLESSHVLFIHIHVAYVFEKQLPEGDHQHQRSLMPHIMTNGYAADYDHFPDFHNKTLLHFQKMSQWFHSTSTSSQTRLEAVMEWDVHNTNIPPREWTPGCTSDNEMMILMNDMYEAKAILKSDNFEPYCQAAVIPELDLITSAMEHGGFSVSSDFMLQISLAEAKQISFIEGRTNREDKPFLD